jgi:flagellar hook-length control protein FliK
VNGQAVTDDATQPDTSAFQDALALVLGTGAGDAAMAGLGAAATTSKAGKVAKADDTSAQSVDTTVAPAGFALPTGPTLPPAMPNASMPAGAAPPRTLATFDNSRSDLGQATEPKALSKLAADLSTPGQLSAVKENGLQAEVAFAATMVERHKPEPQAAAVLSAANPAIEISHAAPTQVAHVQVGAVEARVGARGWDQGVGEKLVWMTSQKLQVAELTLNPPDLGPLKISITLDQNQASAQFVSAHASVREAIESAMPRLREMLADSGITLGNTSVGTDAFREQAQPQQRPQSAQALAAAADSVFVAGGERSLNRSRGQVDTFA